jgi:hypothetical protein
MTVGRFFFCSDQEEALPHVMIAKTGCVETTGKQGIY